MDNDTNLENIRCPIKGCEYTGKLASVAAHVSGKHTPDHSWENTVYSGTNDFKEKKKQKHKSKDQRDSDFDNSRENNLINTMLDNMGSPNCVECPIDGCDYRGEPESVAGHVSASTLDKHIWENTKYYGWRDFVNKHS